MPSTVKVKINQVNHITRGDYNLIEVTGYDYTDNKGFKKSFFAEKKDGGATVNAQNAEVLKQDDWAEFTLDDSSYNNVQSLKAIGAPAGGAPAQAQSGPAPDSVSKKREGRTVSMLNRESALSAAVRMLAGEKITKAVVNSLEKMAYRMEAFLRLGSFDAEPEADAEPAAPVTPIKEDVPGDETPPVPGPEDEDIPF